VNTLIKSALGLLVGIDIEKEENPFVGIQFRFKFMDVPKGKKTAFKTYKKNLKKALLDIDENKLLREGRLEYMDENDELQVAVRRGCVKSEILEIDSSEWGDDTIMWNEQIRFFHANI
jgi:hypothetical protein